MTDSSVQVVRSRREMIRLFDGYAAERVEELDERKLRRPLVKTHLLELLGGGQVASEDRLSAILRRRGVGLEALDQSLFSVSASGIEEMMFLERLRPRILALYSTMESAKLNSWVGNLVSSTPDLDHVWLSGLTFGVLWKLVAKLSRPHRFSRLKFTHDSIFDIDVGAADLEDGDIEVSEDSEHEEVERIVDRRATSFLLVDRVGVIDEKLHELQNIYSPLYAISQLRFPSPIGRGGHDFFENGRVTNRSESFRDHRGHLLFVVRIYEQLLESTEDQAWYSIEEHVGTPGEFGRMVGAPVVIDFDEPLKADVFDHWVRATFHRKRNRFRLWGHPLRLGPTKVHVYGVDRHLWQPLFLELTDKGCVAIIPGGTCGNTVHRLITNIQRYLNPGASAYIGEKPYCEIVEESASGVSYEIDTG